MNINSSQRAWQIGMVANGLCSHCGQGPLVSRVSCQRCLLRRRRNQRKIGGHKPWKRGKAGRIPLEKVGK